MKRVMIILGTRPEAIKLAPIIQLLRKEASIKTIVVSTGQHREILHQTLRVFDLKPDTDLEIMTANQSLNEIASLLFERLDHVLESHKPDLVIVQGDTTSAMVGALSAFHRQIPVAHVEAGLRSGTIHSPFPEELNRKAIALTATLHFCPTESSAQALRDEGITKGVFVTGNTSIDALYWTIKQHPPLKQGFQRRQIVLTAHRRENQGSKHNDIFSALANWLKNRDDVELIYPVHPNPKVREVAEHIFAQNSRVSLVAPLDYVSFTQLMSSAYLIITDSGGVQEEAPALGKPVLVIREETERPEAIAAGVAELVGTSTEKLIERLDKLFDEPEHYNSMAKGDSPFGDGHAAQRIVEAIRKFQASASKET